MKKNISLIIAIASVLIVAGVWYAIYYNSTPQLVRRLGVKDVVKHSQRPEDSSAYAKMYYVTTNGHATEGVLTDQLGKEHHYVAIYDNDFNLNTLFYGKDLDMDFIVGNMETFVANGVPRKE